MLEIINIFMKDVTQVIDVIRRVIISRMHNFFDISE